MELQILISVFTAVLTSIVTGIVVKMRKSFSSLHEEFDTLKESQRNQHKASIVRTYEEAKRNGGISSLELETANREFESYKKLNGNTYIESVMHRLNTQVDILVDENIHVDNK